MAKHAAARLIEHEVAQPLILGDPARLFPEGLAGRYRDAANDDIANLALGVATDDVDGFVEQFGHAATPPGVQLPPARPNGSSIEGLGSVNQTGPSSDM